MKFTSKYIALLLFFFLSLPTIIMAQTTLVSVSGTIKDLNSGQPVSFVNVQLKQQSDSSFVAGTVTDDGGLFTLPDIEAGEYLLAVSFIG